MPTKYSQKTFNQLLELMKKRHDLEDAEESKDLHDAYRKAFENMLNDSKQRHAKILEILGHDYSNACNN